MIDEHKRVRVDGIEWRSMMPWLRLLDSFRMAIQPSKLVLAVALVLAVHLGGLLLDWVWLASHVGGKGIAYGAQPYHALWASWIGGFRSILAAAIGLNFGIASFLNTGSGGVLGGVWGLAQSPVAMVMRHPWYALIFLVWAFLVTALLGGAISRLAAVQACRGEAESAAGGLRFALGRAVWFVGGPLLPLVVLAFLCGLLVLGGLIFFNLPVLDIVGALLFGVSLLLGLVMAVILVGTLFGIHLIFPALAVEATDAFDADARAFNYALGRPIRFLVYEAVVVLLGALTYLLLAVVLAMAVWMTLSSLELGAFTNIETSKVAELGRNPERMTAIAEPVNPDYGLTRGWAPDELWEASPTAGIASWIVSGWLWLLWLLLPAYIVSYYFSSQTWVYLLLRKAADGMEYDDMYVQNEPLAGDGMGASSVGVVSAGGATTTPEPMPEATTGPTG